MLIIMRGASGSGKSTLAEHIRRFVTDQRDYVPPPMTVPLFACLPTRRAFQVFSADHFFMWSGVYKFDRDKLGQAHEQCMRRTIEAARGADPEDVLVVDNTNTSLMEVLPYARIARAYGHSVHVVEIRSRQDTCEQMNVHDVPAKTIAHQLENISRSYGEVSRLGTTHVIDSSYIPSLQP